MTPREREIAGLIARGLTNKQIGRELSISERTVGAHVQNMLNKLTAANRAQIAVMSAQPAPVTSVPTPVVTTTAPWWARLRTSTAWTAGVLAVIVLVVAATDGASTVGTARTVGLPPPAPTIPGTLVFAAQLQGDGAGFGDRYVIGDPDASAVRFFPGAVEYAVVKPGGNTGNGVDMTPLSRYYADVMIQVKPGSAVAFWFQLDAAGPKHPGSHLVAVDTWNGSVQLSYFVAHHDPAPLAEPVRVQGLEAGRTVWLAALVDPPHYVVFVDGVRVIDVRHAPGANLQSPGFGIFGDDVGTVRVTSVRVYAPS